MTSNGKIKVSTNFEEVDSISSSYDLVAFTGLSTSSNYYVSFEKATGSFLEGSGVISQ